VPVRPLKALLQRGWCLVLAAAFLASAGGLAAAELTLPAGAEPVSERGTALGVYQLPIGPETEDQVPVQRFEGRITRRTWRVPGNGSALELLAPLRAQLLTQGYELHLDCSARDCGGFGFRFGIEVVPAPDMMVDISNYHFLSASRGAEAVSLLGSVAAGMGYVQLIDVRPQDVSETVLKPAAEPAVPARPVELAKLLDVRGHVVLTDLLFESGSTRLQDGSYASLRSLADYMQDNPQDRLLLVGHTDTVGTQAQNSRISENRAQSVKDRLVSDLGVQAERIEVAGAGYLAPIASNLTPEGREANRRVEAVLLAN
jgi:OOP family OmpA-OmpF porin